MIYNYFFLFSNQSLYNISQYYQLINILNTKNNIIIIFFIMLLLFKNSKNLHKIFFLKLNVVICIIMILNSNVLTNMNFNLMCWLPYSIQGLNFNLLNGLMLIHPVILYTFYVYILYNICMWYIYCIKVSTKITKKNNFKKNNFMLFYLSLVAVVLGCWWAEQELSWGGWWSWDFVELLALMFLIYFIEKIHSTKPNLDLSRFYTHVFIFLFITVISVRYNLINSIHNFLNLNSQNQYTYYIINIIIILIIYSIYFYNFLNKKSIYISNIFNTLILIFLIYYFIVVKIYFYNYKIIPYLNIKNLYINTILFVFIVYCIYSINTNSILLYITFPFLNNICVVDIVVLYLSIQFLKKGVFLKKRTTYLHFLLALFLLSTFYQTYIFKSGMNEYFDTTLKSIKVNFYSNTHPTLLKNSLDVLECFSTKDFNLSNSLFKSFFCKLTTSDFFYLQESYIYDGQLLTQPNGFIIFLTLFVVLVIIITLFLKKENYVVFL